MFKQFKHYTIQTKLFSINKFQSNINLIKELQHNLKLISLFIRILLHPKTLKTNPKP